MSPKLGVDDGVQLHGQEVVGGVAVVGRVGQTHVLALQRRREVGALGNDEGQPGATEVGVLADDAEHVGGREGPHGAAAARRVVTEPQRGSVEGVALEQRRAVGQHEEAVRGHCGRAVERDVLAGEAVEGKLVNRRRRQAKAMECQEEKQWNVAHDCWLAIGLRHGSSIEC